MKKRIVIAVIACLALATFAATASAMTAQEKYEAMKDLHRRLLQVLQAVRR
jgi:uncharacterized protein involved in exopolysaccharide biosynthesis